jgi:methionine-gamma-lyase
VSLGFIKHYSAPGTSTSSEIPLDEQAEMGLTDGLIRFSIGLDNDIREDIRNDESLHERIGYTRIPTMIK